MPFDLGHNMARLVPTLRLIAEAGIVAPYLVRRSPDRAPQQIPDPLLQDLVGRQADRVACTLGFEELVSLGIGEGCVTPEIKVLHDTSVASDYRFQYCTPSIGTMHVTWPQRAPHDSAELVEYEQWM